MAVTKEEERILTIATSDIFGFFLVTGRYIMEMLWMIEDIKIYIHPDKILNKQMSEVYISAII